MHVVSAGGRQQGHGVEEENSAGKRAPSLGFGPAAPEPLLAARHSKDVGWRGGNDCVSRLLHGSVLLSKGDGLTLLCTVQNPVNANWRISSAL